MLAVPSLRMILLGSMVGEAKSIGEVAFGVSLTFAILVWRLRAATPFAAACGGMVCFMILGTASHADPLAASILHSGLLPLIALFLFTFAATRAGRARRNDLGLAEARKGRNAAQVLANLGMAGLIAESCFAPDLPVLLGRPTLFFVSTLVLAALCEATADTVSSEIGQAFGGEPVLLTSLRRVAPGTDGAMTLLGTAAGIVAAAIVAWVGMFAMRMTPAQAAISLGGGVAGLFFDSLLGATLERRGWLGNDLVNFSSTVFAVLFAFALLLTMG